MTSPAAGLSRLDGLAAGLLWLAATAVWSAGAPRLGYYADDAGWLAGLPRIQSSGQLWTAMRDYMPGRNLHPFWHFLTYQFVGGNPVARLPALHRIQSALDGMVVAAFYLVLRFMRLPASAVWLAAGWFAFWPVHGETHFWLESLPMNLLSTLFTLTFAATSLALGRGRRGWWIWTLDAAAFAGALFTYDQVFLVLLFLVILRSVWTARWIFVLMHLPYLAAFAFWAWLRLSRGAGPMPPGTGELAARVLGNGLHAFRSNFGIAARNRIATLLANATLIDWLAAGAFAVAFGVFAFWLLRRDAARSARLQGRTLAAALLFGGAAYGPVLLWHISPRHQYLPSVGLFAALAVILPSLMGPGRRPAVRVLVSAIMAAGVALGVAANRGESRYWEDAFTAKRRLFDELKQDLTGKDILVLDSFPLYLGPAFLIAPHDAAYGPQLLYRDRPPAPHFRGFLGSAPAPVGLFVGTHTSDGQENFRYISGARVLVVRFDSWRGGSLYYHKDPTLPVPYEFLSARCEPLKASFSDPSASARREKDDLILTLRFQSAIPPHSHLTALIRFWHWDRVEAWGDGQRPGNVWPILLGEPAQDCLKVLRLYSFPRCDQIQVAFFQATRADPPTLVGLLEAKVEP